MSKIIYAIVGPSGSGKSTFGNHLKSKGIPELISHTTRKMRIGEQDGINYYYVNDDQFNKIEFFENAPYSLKRYGLSKKEFYNKTKDYDKVFTIMNREGILSLKEKTNDDYKIKVIYIYSKPETLIKRMIDRGDNSESINERLEYLYSHNELNNIDIADYVIINENKTIEECKQILNFIESRD